MGKAHAPAYTPRIAPKMADGPRPVAPNAHSQALDRPESSRRANRLTTPISLPHRDCLLYLIRFVSTAEFFEDWDTCGGLADQLSHHLVDLRPVKAE